MLNSKHTENIFHLHFLPIPLFEIVRNIFKNALSPHLLPPFLDEIVRNTIFGCLVIEKCIHFLVEKLLYDSIRYFIYNHQVHQGQSAFSYQFTKDKKLQIIKINTVFGSRVESAVAGFFIFSQ